MKQPYSKQWSDVESASIKLRHPAVFEQRPTTTDWRGLKATDRAQPLTDLGRRLLGLHLATTTPKEN